jgi:hypothetical protein
MNLREMLARCDFNDPTDRGELADAYLDENREEESLALRSPHPLVIAGDWVFANLDEWPGPSLFPWLQVAIERVGIYRRVDFAYRRFGEKKSHQTRDYKPLGLLATTIYRALCEYRTLLLSEEQTVLLRAHFEQAETNPVE